MRDNRNHKERREEYFDEDDLEGVNSFDDDEGYKRGQSSRRRYNRREDRNIEHLEDDREDDG